jgi:hypothetical protein
MVIVSQFSPPRIISPARNALRVVPILPNGQIIDYWFSEE